jgi:hypothetical protein
MAIYSDISIFTELSSRKCGFSSTSAQKQSGIKWVADFSVINYICSREISERFLIPAQFLAANVTGYFGSVCIMIINSKK